MDGIEPVGLPPVIPPLEATREVSGPIRAVRSADPQAPTTGRLEEQKKQLARDFESVLLSKLFDQVQESIGDWGFEHEDGTSKQVQGLFWLYLAQDVADKGGFGLWKDFYQYFNQMGITGGAGDTVNEEL